jgi:hypothetical protein
LLAAAATNTDKKIELTYREDYQDKKIGIDFIKLDFGQTVFGLIFTLEFRTNFDRKT